jgi:hypothetical protein
MPHKRHTNIAAVDDSSFVAVMGLPFPWELPVDHQSQRLAIASSAAFLRLPPRPVALPQAALTWLLAASQVRRRMVMVAFRLALNFLVRAPSSDLQSLFRCNRRDQSVAAVADQVSPAGLFQGAAHLEVVLVLEELKQGPLHLAVAQLLAEINRLPRERVAYLDVR